MNDQDLIDALRRELAGYEKYGREDRAEAVRDSLRRLGGLPPKPKRAEKTVPQPAAKRPTTKGSR